MRSIFPFLKPSSKLTANDIFDFKHACFELKIVVVAFLEWEKWRKQRTIKVFQVKGLTRAQQ